MGMGAPTVTSTGTRPMTTEQAFITGSLIFIAASGLALTAFFNFGGLISHVSETGEVHYFRDSTGSNSEQDIHLSFVALLIPSAVIRLFRAHQRPALLEIVIFGVAALCVYAGYATADEAAIIQTLEVTGDNWLALWLAATGTAFLSFLLLCLGWIPRRGTA